MCPPINNGPSLWWCGDSSKETPCQNITDGRFVNYTGASVLGFPPLTSLQDVVTMAGPSSTTVITSGPTSTSSTLSTPSSPANLPKGNDNHTRTTVGVAVGVPLGVAALGFLAFLGWRIARQQRRGSPQGGMGKPQSREVVQPRMGMGEVTQPTSELDNELRQVEMPNRPPTPTYRPYRPA